jgi:hypothetical protein
MRDILQQTATGMLPGTSWTEIMTNAANDPNAAANGNNLRATSYVDPAELAALPGLTGVIPANMGDTAGTPLGIFNGPFGGTSGVANVVSPYNATVQPPLMNWSGNTTLLLANASTTPQEFFLGSQYTGLSAAVTKLSASNRWGQIIYPAIRFGYKQPGNQFVARRVWWRIPVVYQPAQPNAEYQALTDAASVNRYPSAPANYVLSVYEIPSQLPISGNANLRIGLNDDNTAWGSGITIAGPTLGTQGSIYGGKIQLYGGTYNSVSSQQQVNVDNPATVGPNGGVVYPDSGFDQPGEREKMAVQTPTAFPPGVAAPVSVAGNDGKVLLVPVMPGNDFYMQAPGNAPKHWDLYARPYYKCRIRVIISNATNSPIIYSPNQTPTINTKAGAISVTIYVLPDTASPPQPDQILGFRDSSAVQLGPFSQLSFEDTSGTFAAAASKYGMNYTSTAAGDRNILVIDVPQMVQALGNIDKLGSPAQLYSIYIGMGNPPNPPDPPSPPYNDPGIAITDTHDLSTYGGQPFLFSSGLSIVTNQTLYLLDAFNQGATRPPTSIYAPQVRYGISGINPQVNLTAQVAVVATPAPSPSPAVNPLSFKSSDGSSIPSSNITATLNEVTDPTKIPPITALNLLFTIEKERTN